MGLRAADVMRTAVVTVAPAMPLAELEDFLLSRRIGGAPVVERGRVIGIVSRSDVVRSLSLERSLAGMIETLAPAGAGAPAPAPAAPRGTKTVRDSMVTDLVTVSPDTPLADVARVLVERHLHRVVVTQDGKLVGIITSLDLVRLIAHGALVAA
jgi:CBS domain-containing protein